MWSLHQKMLEVVSFSYRDIFLYFNSNSQPNIHNHLIYTSIKELHIMAKMRIHFQYFLETLDHKLSQSR